MKIKTLLPIFVILTMFTTGHAETFHTGKRVPLKDFDFFNTPLLEDTRFDSHSKMKTTKCTLHVERRVQGENVEERLVEMVPFALDYRNDRTYSLLLRAEHIAVKTTDPRFTESGEEEYDVSDHMRVRYNEKSFDGNFIDRRVVTKYGTKSGVWASMEIIRGGFDNSSTSGVRIEIQNAQDAFDQTIQYKLNEYFYKFRCWRDFAIKP